MKTYLKPSELTPENYYSYQALGGLQNEDRNVNSDIMSFTALMNWEEKVRHYEHYLKVTTEKSLQKTKGA